MMDDNLLTNVLGMFIALMLFGAISLIVWLLTHLVSFRRERCEAEQERAQAPSCVVMPRTCPLCGDDLDVVIDVMRVQNAANIASVLNQMAGVSATVHARVQGGLCVSTTFKRLETSQRNYAQMCMLGWQMAHPDETIYLSAGVGETLPVGPREVR